MTRWKVFAVACVSCLAAMLCWISLANAGKPVKPPRGGGDNSDTRYRIEELGVVGLPIAVGEVSADGIVSVAIDSVDEGSSSAAYARVRASDGTVLSSGFLPEPPFVDNDGNLRNGYSAPVDVNSYGNIVGSAGTFDPGATDDPNPSRAIVWSYDGSEYSYQLLPLPAGSDTSFSSGINDLNVIVGSAKSLGERRAVLWDAVTQSVVQLNTQATADLGWELRTATDINDDGLIVGNGTLNGAHRGFLLDFVTGDIWAVPLVGPATNNVGYGIDSFDRVVGYMFSGSGIFYGTNPDFVLGYSWDGPGTDPALLPSITNSTAHAFYLDDWGATMGNSYILDDDGFSHDAIPTLWEFDPQSSVVATELKLVIPSKPNYKLLYGGDVNNLGWIGVEAQKFAKGRYTQPALLLIPNN